MGLLPALTACAQSLLSLNRSVVTATGLCDLSLPAYLSPVTVKDPEDGRVALVGDVGEHLEAVLHVVPPPLDGVHGYVVVLELPGFGELCVQDVEASQSVILHHLRHFPLHHLHGVPAGLDDGFHLVRVEEITPQRQAYAQQEQCLRPEEKITHDPTQKRQERHCVSYHHTHPNCARLSPPMRDSLHPLSANMKKSIHYCDFQTKIGFFFTFKMVICSVFLSQSAYKHVRETPGCKDQSGPPPGLGLGLILGSRNSCRKIRRVEPTSHRPL